MTQDSSMPWDESSPPLHEEDGFDLPPSYDATLATGPSFTAGSSSTSQPLSAHHLNASSAVDVDRTIPDHLKCCFTSPSNAEPLFREGEPLPDIMSKIEWRSRGKIIETWDPRLSDPNTLYDFVRAMTMTLPSIKIRCLGSHTETWERDETVWENGTAHTRKKGEMHHVVDFDFTIDLTEIINHPSNHAHIHLGSISPWAPLLRGSNVPRYAASCKPDDRLGKHGRGRAAARRHRRTGYQTLSSGEEWEPAQDRYGPIDLGRRPTRQEKVEFDAWEAWRVPKGIPRWVNPADCPEFWETRMKGKGRRAQRDTTRPINSSDRSEAGEAAVDLERGERRQVGDQGQADLKEWCEAFCTDRGILKDFVLIKGIWGWDRTALLSAINGAIASTGYPTANIQTSLDLTPVAIIVKPDNFLSRALGNMFIYFLSWITMIYPLIWIWKRNHPRGGAVWSVARASYAMKYYPPLPSTFANETIGSARDRLPALMKLHPELPADPSLQYGPKGVHYLLGRKEGDWFREWEERIRMGVRVKFKGDLQGGVIPGTSGSVNLDGY
ncbi:hypothetical protein IAR55_007125 [Kwoniella newhampshirensis]|uniref:Uncharacterized protein n=1 Tax=Kwoniella newhampshirensis TaxID=1651941 RepID=A0AAW0YWC1_9TREE